MCVCVCGGSGGVGVCFYRPLPEVGAGPEGSAAGEREQDTIPIPLVGSVQNLLRYCLSYFPLRAMLFLDSFQPRPTVVRVL